MKRLILLLILLCVPAAGDVHATVKNSKHDFSYLGTALETCAYCHSVHHSVGGLGRPAYMGDLPEITEVYNSATLDHKITISSVSQTDAPLCLTCHDGASLGDIQDANIRASLEGKILNTTRDLTSDLSNDHPIGFIYDESLDDEIRYPDPPVYVKFGPERNEMWCSTCHNVHDNTHTPFLTMSNDRSALCYNCHIK